jgi:hypothetical protein
LLGNRLNGLGAIDGLLSARNTCEATYSMVNQYGRYYTSKTRRGQRNSIRRLEPVHDGQIEMLIVS